MLYSDTGRKRIFHMKQKEGLLFSSPFISHALNGFLYRCECPTAVGQPALGLEPAPILNDVSKIIITFNL